jgi:hypothetical protein
MPIFTAKNNESAKKCAIYDNPSLNRTLSTMVSYAFSTMVSYAFCEAVLLGRVLIKPLCLDDRVCRFAAK